MSLTYEFPKVVTLGSTGQQSFQLDPYSRYNFKIYINNPKVSNTITFYDSGGNALDPLVATSDTEIVVKFGYYQRVTFADSNSYSVKMIVQKLVFSSPEEAGCCPPQVEVSASQSGVARADQFIQDSVGNLEINLAAISTTANLNVNIAAWNVGTINVNIAAQSVGNLAVNLAAISATTSLNVNVASQSANINVNIAAQSGNISVNLAASSITLNVQGTIAVTLGTTTYQSIPISIVGQQIGNLAVNIAAQSVGNLAVNIAAQSVGNLNVNIAAQSGNINVNLAAQSGNINVSLAASSVTLTVTGTSLLTQLQGYTGTAWKNIAVDASGNMAVNISAQSVGNLAVNIAAQSVGNLNVNIAAQSGNISVNLAASSITLNVQGTIAVTLGTTTYQSIPISIVGQQIGNLLVDIKAQSVGNLAVNIAAQSVGNLAVNIAAQSVGNLNVNIAAQSGNINVNLAAQSGNINVSLAASSVTLTVTGTSLLTQLQGYTGTAWKNIAVDASGNMAVNISAQSVGNLAVNIAAWNAGTINVNISSTTGNLNVSLAAISTTTNLNVNIAAQAANVNVNLAASSITLNVQGTIAVTLGSTTYQSIPISIVGQQIGNLLVDIKAQSVGNLAVNIAAQSVGNLNVNIAAQSGNINVNLAASSATVTVSVSGTANVNISSTSGNIPVSIAASSATVNVSVGNVPTVNPSFETALSSALTSGSNYTSLSVNATPVSLLSGQSLTLVSGTNTQVVTVSQTIPAGSTSIPVNSFTANYAYPIGTSVIGSLNTTVLNSVLNVNITGQSIGNLNVNIAAQSVGNLAVNIAAWNAGTINVNISSQSGNINVNLAASAITLNVQGTIAVTLGTTTYQSIPISIVGQQIGNLAIDIKAQSVGNLNVNLAAQSGNISVNLAASSVTLTVTGTSLLTQLQGYTGTAWKNIAVDASGNMAVNISAQSVGNLAVNIAAQSVGNLNVNIAAQSGNVSVNLAASAITLNVQGTIAVTLGTTTYQSIPISIVGQQIGNLAVNIAAQSVGNLAVNLAAISTTTNLNVNIAAQAANVNVNLAASSITLNVNVTNATINISGSVTVNAGTAIIGSINQIVSPVTSRSKIVSGYQESAVFLNNGASGLFLSGSNADSESNYLIQGVSWTKTNAITGSFASVATNQTVASRFSNGTSQQVVQGLLSYVALDSSSAPVSASVNVRAAIYSDSSGSPGTLLAQSLVNQFNLVDSTATGYLFFPTPCFFVSPVTLAASTAYWLVLTVVVTALSGSSGIGVAQTSNTASTYVSTASFVSGFPSAGSVLEQSTSSQAGYFVLLEANAVTVTSIPAANLSVAAATTLNGQIVFKLGLTTDSGGVLGITSLTYTIKDTTSGAVLASNTLNVNLLGVGAVTITDTKSLGATTLNAGDNLQVLISSITFFGGPQDGSAGSINVYLDNTNGTSYVVMPLQ